MLGNQGSNLKPAVPKTAALPVELLPRAPARCRPRLTFLQGIPDRRIQGRSGTGLEPDLESWLPCCHYTIPLCPRCDSNAHCSAPHADASCRWATRTWSHLPESNRLPALYERAALPDELRRLSSGSWGRTNVDGFRGRRPAIRRSRNGAEGADRTRKPSGLS